MTPLPVAPAAGDRPRARPITGPDLQLTASGTIDTPPPGRPPTAEPRPIEVVRGTRADPPATRPGASLAPPVGSAAVVPPIPARTTLPPPDAAPPATGDADEPATGAGRARERERAYRERDIPRHRSLVLEWIRQWIRGTELPVTEPLPEVAPEQVAVTFVGHATVLVRYANLTIACDPMLGSWAGAARRVVAPGLSADDLSNVDLVLISHAHADHLHRPTLELMPRSATVVLPSGTARHVEGLGFARVLELAVGQSLEHRGVDVATAAARHRGRGRTRALSYVIRGDGPSVFFCGDSGYFSGFAEVGRRYQPHIAALPIGGYCGPSFRDRHMNPLDALHAFEDLRARVLVPIHHGSFARSYELLRDPVVWLSELVRARELDAHVAALEPGASRLFALAGGGPGP
jgi:L-ascorbate metabolism protein UlaG (beta-lactamase superfamily)